MNKKTEYIYLFIAVFLISCALIGSFSIDESLTITGRAVLGSCLERVVTSYPASTTRAVTKVRFGSDYRPENIMVTGCRLNEGGFNTAKCYESNWYNFEPKAGYAVYDVNYDSGTNNIFIKACQLNSVQITSTCQYGVNGDTYTPLEDYVVTKVERTSHIRLDVCKLKAACTDPDGGLDFFEKGTCTDTTDHVDTCSDGVLTEWSCIGSNCISTQYTCSSGGCENGACLNCVDTDDGYFPYIPGTCTDKDGRNWKDQCKVYPEEHKGYLEEYECTVSGLCEKKSHICGAGQEFCPHDPSGLLEEACVTGPECSPTNCGLCTTQLECSQFNTGIETNCILVGGSCQDHITPERECGDGIKFWPEVKEEGVTVDYSNKKVCLDVGSQEFGYWNDVIPY